MSEANLQQQIDALRAQINLLSSRPGFQSLGSAFTDEDIIRSPKFYALSSGSHPTSDGTGFFASSVPEVFSDGTEANAGTSKVGLPSVVFNTDGDFVAGDTIINESGIAVGGHMIADGDGLILDDGRNIFMDTTDFDGALDLSASGGFSALATGANGPIYCIAKDGSGNIYVGGEFSQIGGVAAKRLAKWNGSTWSRCGVGIGDGAVKCIAVVGSTIYFGGTFTKTVPLTEETISLIDLTGETSTTGGSVTTGASVSTTGGAEIALNYIAKFNGTQLQLVDNGSTVGANNPVRAMAVDGTTLYVGGEFTSILGTSATRVAAIDTTADTASALSTGLDGTCYSLLFSTDLYAGGAFTSKVRKYSGGAWADHGSSLPNNTVYALAKTGNDLYAVGAFTSPASYIGKCTSGGAWGAVGSGLAGVGYAVAIDGSNIIAGYDGTEYAKYYTGSTWASMGSGLGGIVYAAYVDTTWLLGGAFTTADSSAMYRITRYSASSAPTSVSLQTALDVLDDHQHYFPIGGHAGSTLAAGGKQYASLFRSGSVTAANEATGYIPLPAGTIRNLQIYISSSQPGTGPLVVTVRKNGVSTALTATIAAGSAAGVYSDTTHSVTWAAGDKFTLELDNQSSGTSADPEGFSVEFTTLY